MTVQPHQERLLVEIVGDTKKLLAPGDTLVLHLGPNGECGRVEMWFGGWPQRQLTVRAILATP